MLLHIEKLNYLILITISITTGLFSYFVLSYLLVTPKITIPLSVVFPILTFGLSKYYSTSNFDINRGQKQNLAQSDNQLEQIPPIDDKNGSNVPSVLFVLLFASAILISSFVPKHEFHIFINWNEIGATDIVQLGSAILLCFFLPGYAIVLIITKKIRMDPLLKVLLAYLLSILITGLTAYASSLFFDKAITESKYLFVAVYLSILASLLIFSRNYRITHQTYLQTRTLFHFQTLKYVGITIGQRANRYSSELIVFGSLLLLLVIATYYLYGGVTIGDQWYHQGRALLFMSGSFREAAVSGAEAFYTPFQSAFLASLTTLSGVPLVNSYASFAFVNMVLIFAFYYFFLSWVPRASRKAALLAASLFTIGAGFGWIYLLNTVSTAQVSSAHSILETINKMGPLDIISSSNFLISTAPQFSTGLTYIALPAGFVLLGSLRTRLHSSLTNIAIVTTVAILGMVSNDEFYIFIIIACLLPIIIRMEARNYMYIGFILAISFVYLLDIAAPVRFFTLIEIFGIPLILLSLLLVIITWTFYASIAYFRKLPKLSKSHLNKVRRLIHHGRLKFLTQVSIISLVAYLYLLTFIVLNLLPLQTIIDQTRGNTIPWYLYPMRIGIVGLFGLAFILSYMLRKFEKQIFIFGILVIISFITGPYYDEHRFSKYMMAGMIGFASLMIYNILRHNFSNKPLINSTLIGIIIATSGLSTLIYIGYNSLIFQTQDYVNTLARRHFPSMSELHLFEILHDKIDIDSEKYNVISFLNEYNRLADGLMAKIPAFSGVPYDKIRQDPLTLNASTLDALYHHLAYSDARYIIVPKASIQDGRTLTESTHFVLDHFKRVYEDANYILLEIPTLAPPSSSSSSRIGVAMIYNNSDDSTPGRAPDTRTLDFDNKTFDMNGIEKSVLVQKVDGSQVINLLGETRDKGISIWSKNLDDKKPNYIGASFRILSDNKNRNNDVRVEWQEGDNGYYTKLSNDGLELYQKSKYTQYKRILLRNIETSIKNMTWYTLKVYSSNDSINIYLNDSHKIKVPRVSENKTGAISKIGLTTNYNNVEFKPLKVGNIAEYPQKIHDASKFYNYYYPLSLLALSKANYDLFSNSDLSSFSKPVVLVPDSLIHNNVTLQNYLDYVIKGGTLVVVNTQNNSSAIFNQLFSIKSFDSKQEDYTNIAGHNNHKVFYASGRVNRINMTSQQNIDTVASYRNSKNESVSPFILEKNFSSGGRIILLNSKSYFDSISNSPIKYFLSLSNISQLLPVGFGSGTISQNTSLPSKAFIGKMKVYGNVSLYSSSLSLLNDNDVLNQINASRIAIFNGTNSPIIVNNASIKDLKITGDYAANINMSGSLELPDMRTTHDFVGIQMPAGFNMTVRISPKVTSHMEIVTQNQYAVKTFKLSNDSKVEFYGIKSSFPGESIPVLLKRPEMKVDGHVIIKNTYFDGFVNERGGLNLGLPLDLVGHMQTKFDIVDKFNQPYHNSTRTTSITYLEKLDMDGNFDNNKHRLNLPGDIYFGAEERGEVIPLKEVLTSSGNIILVSVLISTVVVASKFIWSKKRLKI